MSKEKQFVSAVIYVHNAEHHLASFLQNVDRALFDAFEKYEIICVNDASTDGTKQIVEAFKCLDPQSTLSLLNMSYYQGLEIAMTAGVDLAIGDFVLEFDDSRVAFEPSLVHEIYTRALEGFDIVNVASDVHGQWSSRVFYMIFNRYADLQYTLGTEVFRLLSRRAINRVRGMSDASPYRKAQYANSGLKMTTKSAHITKVVREDLKTFGARSQLAVDALILFTDLGYRFAITMTFLMMMITVVVAAYAVGVYIFENPVEGWTPTILFLSFAFFGMFGILAVVIKYLSIIVSLIFKKQKYVYESIQKYSKS